MKPAERLVAAYTAVDEAAPALTLGNDPTSGYSIIAHVAINQMRQLSPTKAKVFLEGWAKTVADDLERRTLLKTQ